MRMTPISAPPLPEPPSDRPPAPPPLTSLWLDTVFRAQAVHKGGVVRCAVADVEREVGRAAFIDEVRRRRFHLVECGGQFVVICNAGSMQVLC